MSITVIKPGLLSSFQDLGRFGHQHLGVPASGAMDSRAHRLANLLAGNTENEATLEITLVGPTLRFDAPGCIAISGAHLSPTLNNEPIPNNRPLIVRAGDILAFGARSAGLRSYIAWNGGIALPSVLGSRSTYLRGGFGGFHGRALRKGDVLNMLSTLDAGVLDDLEHELWKIKVYLPAILGLVPRTGIRVMRGAHTGLFTDASIADFFAGDYRIGPQSERMGYRLQGPQLSLKSSTQLLSEATSFGSIQVPPDGNPIVLMADRQTTGGYAKIGHVATVDLPSIAQCMPGETLRFTEIALSQAQQLDGQREDAFGRLHQTLAPLRALFER
ncbi:carboxylase [Pollutimonas nitritireducens]|uniref:Carboxylase n=1 Tax=Pollutimonas nitritireducens TaxID=2045209 RepID=A0A2N4UBN3_9BURK|nr:biotin-dependent carboxyltransferase family protein [Pollutimonas nitritireducens]PLC52434.1 carboxylase [Pollutimonas nitritireducens]